MTLNADTVRAEDLLSDSYVAPNVEPFDGSCDVCCEGEKRIIHVDQDTSAYVCDGCIRNEKVAIAAAAMVLMHAPDQGDWPDHDHYLALAELAVNAYVMTRFRAARYDGSGA